MERKYICPVCKHSEQQDIDVISDEFEGVFQLNCANCDTCLTYSGPSKNQFLRAVCVDISPELLEYDELH